MDYRVEFYDAFADFSQQGEKDVGKFLIGALWRILYHAYAYEKNDKFQQQQQRQSVSQP